MGSNKALLALPGEPAHTFVERLTSLLSALCAETLLVARDGPASKEYVFPSLPSPPRLIYDREPDQGPLMGLYSGLLALNYQHALVLAVDLPFARPELLAFLCTRPLREEIAMPLIGGVPQVLLARYPRSILPVVEACLQAGRRDPRALLERVPVNFLAEEELRAVDPDLRSFVNINTPEDWQRARSWL